MTTFLILALFAAAAAIIAPIKAGAGMIFIAGFFVGVTSMVFDYAMQMLVVQFHTQIYSLVADTLGEVWTVFRDIANIVIIGMFAFIAITMILGVQSFNAKKMVAKILMIAVLINFSMLFSRIIIYSSNFVASQFYYAMALNANDASGTPRPSLDIFGGHASDVGIGGQFMTLLGLPSAFNAQATVQKVYEDSNPQKEWWSFKGGAMAVIYGFTSAVLMIVTACVLAYAIFLLVVRTILFLFLVAVSALAFASYLMPGWGNQYWKVWWTSLLKNAVFAPLLMIMLWATLIISYALVSSRGAQRSFDKLFSDPTASSGTLAVIIFLIIIGMLIASIRFASTFSHKIGGFDFAAMAPAFGLAQLGRLGGFLGRNSIGRTSAYASDRLGYGARKLYDREDAGKMSKFTGRMMDLAAQGFKAPAKREFNAANLLGKELGKFGLKGGFAGQTKFGGQLGREKQIAEERYEQAKRLTKPDKEVFAEALKESKDKHSPELQALEEAHKETAKQMAMIDTHMQTTSQNKDVAERELAALEKQRLQVASDKSLNESQRNSKIEDIKVSMAQRKSAISEQDAHIKEANLKATELTVRSRDNRMRLDEKILNAANEIAKSKGSFQSRVDAKAPEIALNRLTNVPFVATGLSTVNNDRIASQMRQTATEVENGKLLEKIRVELTKNNRLTEKGQDADVRANFKLKNVIEDAADKSSSAPRISSDHKENA